MTDRPRGMFLYLPEGLDVGCDCTVLSEGSTLRKIHGDTCRHGAVERVHGILSGAARPSDRPRTPVELRVLADELHAAAAQWERDQGQ